MTTLMTRRPLTSAFRVSLFEREVKERLSGAALDLLIAHSLVLSEGQRSTSSTARAAFFGSMMLTVDLKTLQPLVREPIDSPIAERMVALLAGDPRLTERVRRLAEREAVRLSNGPAPLESVELRVRLAGTVLHIDVDIEGQPERHQTVAR